MKNHIKIINKLLLWNSANILIEKFNSGLTNFSYLVRDGNKKYVARFAPKSNLLLGLNRKKEIYNTKIAHSLKLGPDIVKFFPRYNLLIVEHIDGDTLSANAAREHTKIKLLARLLKTLHNGPKFKGEFNPFKTIRKDIALAKTYQSWLPDNIDTLLGELKKVEKTIGKFHKTYPCHLDLVMENIIYNKSILKLIDWEYSANSDYRFDLAMLSLKGNFSNQHDRLLLKEYDGDSHMYEQIQIMKSVVCFREAAWSLAQLGISKIKFDYKKYAVDCLSLFMSFTINKHATNKKIYNSHKLSDTKTRPILLNKQN